MRRLRGNNAIAFCVSRITNFAPFGVMVVKDSIATGLNANMEDIGFNISGEPLISFEYNGYALADPQCFNFSFSGSYYICGYNVSGPLLIESLSVQVHNEWGWLPVGSYPIIYISFIEAIIYVVVLIFWYINKRKHPLLVIKLHTFIGIALICQLVFSIFNFFFVKNFNASNSYKLSFGIYLIFGLRSFSKLLLSLLLAEGLSLIADSFPCIEMSSNVFVSFLLSSSQLILLSSYAPHMILWQNVAVLIIFIASYFGFFLFIHILFETLCDDFNRAYDYDIYSRN